MGLFSGLFSSKSSSASTSRTDVKTNNVNASNNEGTVVAGLQNSTVNITDGGAFGVVERSTERLIDSNEDVTRAALNFGEDALDYSASVTGKALNFADNASDRAFDFGEEALNEVAESTATVVRSNASQLAAIQSLAESVSVGDRETAAEMGKWLIVAVVVIAVLVLIFLMVFK
ncbi:MAG: hypothetical protein ACPGMR_11485 [Pontibacterium sp.]